MKPEELKALLDSAVTKIEKQSAINDGLKSQIADLTTKLASTADADNIEEMKNEISDLRSKMKQPVTVVTEADQKNALKTVAVKAYKEFFSQRKNGQTNFGDFTFGDAITGQMKSLNITNPSEGALAVANILSNDLIEYGREVSPILSEIGSKPGITRDFRELVLIAYPSVSDGIENVAGANLPETSTQEYAEVRSEVVKLQAFPQLTDEALHANYNIYGDLVRLLGDQIAVELAAKVLFGDGTAKNGTGLLSSGRIDITASMGESWKPSMGLGARAHTHLPALGTGVAGKLGTDDKSSVAYLIDLTNSLPTKYLNGAKFYMNRKTKGVIQKLVDDNGQPIFLPSYMAGSAPTILGYPVVIDDTLPDVAVDATPIIFGDLSRAFAMGNGDIDYMQLNPYKVSGVTIVEYHKEIFTIIQASDAVMVCATTANEMV